MNPCTIDGCDRPAMARSWCNAHWKRWRRTGDPHGIRPRHPDPQALIEDLTWLADTGVGATEAAQRTGLRTVENLSKWLYRRGEYDLALRLAHQDYLPLTDQKAS